MAQHHPSSRWAQSAFRAQSLTVECWLDFSSTRGTQHPAPLPLPGPLFIKARAQPPGWTSCQSAPGRPSSCLLLEEEPSPSSGHIGPVQMPLVPAPHTRPLRPQNCLTPCSPPLLLSDPPGSQYLGTVEGGFAS